METTAAYTISTKPATKRTKKVEKAAKPIPEGYVSAEEFNLVFEQKIRAAYENL